MLSIEYSDQQSEGKYHVANLFHCVIIRSGALVFCFVFARGKDCVLVCSKSSKISPLIYLGNNLIYS